MKEPVEQTGSLLTSKKNKKTRIKIVYKAYIL